MKISDKKKQEFIEKAIGEYFFEKGPYGRFGYEPCYNVAQKSKKRGLTAKAWKKKKTERKNKQKGRKRK